MAGIYNNLNLPDQSASLLSGPPNWSKVLDQPVTARENWLQRNSYTSHWSRWYDCLNLPDQSASLLSGPSSWLKVTIVQKTFPTRFVQLPVSLNLSDPQQPVTDASEMPNSAGLVSLLPARSLLYQLLWRLIKFFL